MRTITPRLRARTSNRTAAPPRLRPQLVADAVVASYIHEISVRHGHGESPRRRRERRPPRDRLVGGVAAQSA